MNATVKTLSVEVETLKAQVAELQAQLLQTQKECLAAIAAMQPTLVAAVTESLKPLRETRVPRPANDDTGRVARSAAISRLSLRFPERKSFTSIEVMDEMCAA